MKKINPREQFIENLAYIISREISNPYIDLWEEIKDFFDKVNFKDYDDIDDELSKDEAYKNILYNFDNCLNILSDNFNDNKLKSLFKYISDVLDFWALSDEPHNTAYEIWSNQTILDFNLF